MKLFKQIIDSIPPIIINLISAIIIGILFLLLTWDYVRETFYSDTYFVPAWAVTLVGIFFMILFMFFSGTVIALSSINKTSKRILKKAKSKEPIIDLFFRDDNNELTKENSFKPIFYKVDYSKEINDNLIDENELVQILENEKIDENSLNLSIDLSKFTNLKNGISPPNAKEKTLEYLNKYNEKIQLHYESKRESKYKSAASVELKMTVKNSGTRPGDNVIVSLFIPHTWKIYRVNPHFKIENKPIHPLDFYRNQLGPKLPTLADYLPGSPYLQSPLLKHKFKPTYIGPDAYLKHKDDFWDISYWLKSLAHNGERVLDDSLWLLPTETTESKEFEYNIHADNMTNDVEGVLRINITPSIESIDKS